MASLLEMRNIDKRYDGPAVLAGLSMSVSAGERVSIRGVSGSGKSTLLYLAAGLETADAGEVLLGDTSLAGLSDRAMSAVRAKQIGFVPITGSNPSGCATIAAELQPMTPIIPAFTIMLA